MATAPDKDRAAPAPDEGRGLDTLFGRGLLETIWRRRTHRVSQGSSVLGGTMSYESTAPRALSLPIVMLNRLCARLRQIFA